MGKLNKGSKPTRAERKAEKKAAKEAAKEAAFDARELAREEKRADKAANSRWGRRKRAAAEREEQHHMPDEFDHGNPAAEIGAFTPLSEAMPESEPEPQRRSLGRRILGRKAASEPDSEFRNEPALSQINERGTQIRPKRTPGTASEQAPMNSRAAPFDFEARSQPSPAGSFASLRRALKSPGGRRGKAARKDLDDVLVLNDPVAEPDGGPLVLTNEYHIAPLRPDSRTADYRDTPQDVAGMAAAPRADHHPPPAQGSRLSENWLGLWVSGDGEAIFIEEDDDGWFAVTVLADPTTTCFSGPDFPEIQSYRMPAWYSRETVGEFDGERLSVITVPGLPDTHRSPMMYIYFLTSIPVVEGGGSRFATPDDPSRRVFIAADFELGTVNPWSDRDDIEWIDPAVNFYKAPGKLDTYMMRRMAKDDPLN